MKQEDFEKYEKAKDVLGTIKKIEAQLESIDMCNIVKIYGAKVKGISQYNFDINETHPFHKEAEEFIKSFKNYLFEKKNSLQKEFEEL